MKRRVALLMVGVMVGLTACGQQAAQTPAEQAQQTEEATTAETVGEADIVTEETDASFVEELVLSTDLYTITVPEEFKGKFLAKIDGESISFYDKASYEAGFGGFAFEVCIDKNNELTAGGMFTKVGEYLNSQGEFCNILKGYPSDVQWDYTTYETMEKAVDYNNLYNAADTIIGSIEANGDGTCMYGAGIKGEDLYFVTLQNFVDACAEGWDASKFEEEGLSPEYGALIMNDGDKAFDEIGYAYKDISNDGVDELLIGLIDDSADASVVYDIFTMVDREPAHVVSGSARDRYYGLEYGGVANEFSSGADESGVSLYIIEPGTSELYHQFTLKYDGYTDEKNPWFVGYGQGEDIEFEAITEDEFNSRVDSTQEQYLKLDFKPISDLIQIDYSKVDLSKYATFTNMIDDFKPGMGYANVKLGDTDVFLVSTGTYNGENNTKNAIDSSVFMYNDKGEIVYLGQVASGGTAYPLMVADGCLFTGGHHNVVKSTVKDGKLVTEEEASETFDTEGNSTYYYGSEKVDDDANLTRLFDEYFSGEAVDFSAVN